MDPVATRPYMPDYPIVTTDEGLLDWSWAMERLERSREYWVATVDASGAPAVTPVWGILIDGEVWFSCGPTSRKARNLRTRPNVTLTTNEPAEPVIVEGTASFVDDRPAAERFAAAVEEKYHSGSTVEFFMANALIRVTPHKVLAMNEADFTGSPTRWRL